MSCCLLPSAFLAFIEERVLGAFFKQVPMSCVLCPMSSVSLLGRFTNSYTSGMESHVCSVVCFGQGYNGKGNNCHWQPYDVKDNRDDSIFCYPRSSFRLLGCSVEIQV